MLVDLKKWDKVNFKDIVEGETILMIRKDNFRTFLYEGKVLKWDDCHKWWNMTGNWYASDTEDGVMDVHFYRKQFTLPTIPLSIIEGEPRHLSGSTSRYILLEGGAWVNASDGGKCFPDALLANFKNWKIVHEGMRL